MFCAICLSIQLDNGPFDPHNLEEAITVDSIAVCLEHFEAVNEARQEYGNAINRVHGKGKIKVVIDDALETLRETQKKELFSE